MCLEDMIAEDEHRNRMFRVSPFRQKELDGNGDPTSRERHAVRPNDLIRRTTDGCHAELILGEPPENLRTFPALPIGNSPVAIEKRASTQDRQPDRHT